MTEWTWKWLVVTCLMWHAPVLALPSPSHPESGATDDWVEEPVVVKLDPDVALETARLAYLGGGGIGGLLLLGNGPLTLLVPAIGAVAGAWSAQQANPEASGLLWRTVAASYAAAAVHQFLNAVLVWPAVVTVFVVAGIGVTALLLGLGINTAGFVGNHPRTSDTLQAGMGAGATVMGIAGITSLVVPGVAVAVLLSRAASVATGDLVRGRLMARPSARDIVQKDTGGKLLGRKRPLDETMTWGLVTAAVHGANQRVGWLDALPGVGPILAAWKLRGSLNKHAWDARQVAGLGRVWGSMQTRLDLVLGARALLMTVAWSMFPLSVVTLAGAGVAVVASAMTGGAAAVLLSAWTVGALAALGVMLASASTAMLAATVLQSVTPWLIGWWTVRPWEEPTLMDLTGSTTTEGSPSAPGSATPRGSASP